MNRVVRLPDMANAQHYRAVGMAFLAGILWSLGGLFIKRVAWNPLAIAGARSAIASLVLLAFTPGGRPRFTWSRIQIGGAIAYAATVISFVAATRLTTAANAILLQYTAPIYAALLGMWLLHERVSRLDVATMAIVLGGMALFFFDQLTAGGLLGNALSIVSGMFYASLIVLLRAQKDGSPMESVLLGNLFTAVIGAPFMLQGWPDLSGWLGLILLGVFQLGLSYVVYATAIKHLTALEAAMIPVVEPILNPVWVFLFIGEAPGRFALLGGALVLLAVTGRYVVSVLGRN
jgi:drug/metabolite transporter (DMT)-like permease